MDSHHSFRPKPSLSVQLSGTMFDQPEEETPSPPASPAPSSGSSPRMHHGVDTSQAAEERQRTVIRGQRAAVLNYVRAHYPVNRNDIEAGTGIRINSVCSTVASLKRDGLILDCDGKDDRPLKWKDGGHAIYPAPNSGKKGEAA